jgi:hypothetical protein
MKLAGDTALYALMARWLPVVGRDDAGHSAARYRPDI